MSKHAQPFNDAFTQTGKPSPEPTRATSEKERENDTSNRMFQWERLPPSSFAETALPLGTARNDRADSCRSSVHSCFSGSTFRRHASSGSHRTSALENGSGTWAQHTTHSIFLLAPDHSSRMASRKDALTLTLRWRRGGRRRAATLDRVSVPRARNMQLSSGIAAS